MESSPDRPLSCFSTLLMSLVCAIWGGAFVAIKIGLFDMPPLGSAALRFFLMTVVLFACGLTAGTAKRMGLKPCR